MIIASQLRNGMGVKFEGRNYKVMAVDYHPGQGKMGGVAHVRLKDLSTGTIWEHSFRAELKLESLVLEKQILGFLYSDSEQSYFMNPQTYDQLGISNSLIGPPVRFLRPDMQVTVEFLEDVPVSVIFPDIVEVQITDTAPAVHQQQDGTWKPARLENGVEVLVPQFIKNGDTIRLDVHSGKYMDRIRGGQK